MEKHVKPRTKRMHLASLASDQCLFPFIARVWAKPPHSTITSTAAFLAIRRTKHGDHDQDYPNSRAHASAAVKLYVHDRARAQSIATVPIHRRGV